MELVSPCPQGFDGFGRGFLVFGCRPIAQRRFSRRKYPALDRFGGEEGYIHEKFRQAGHRTLCLPFLRWLHRFPRPHGAPYRLSWEDRIRNYVIGFAELGLPLAEMEKHFGLSGRRDSQRLRGMAAAHSSG